VVKVSQRFLLNDKFADAHFDHVASGQLLGRNQLVCDQGYPYAPDQGDQGEGQAAADARPFLG
jgi:hypothetical protein